MLDFDNEFKNAKRHFYIHMVISYYNLKFIARFVFELRRVQNEYWHFKYFQYGRRRPCWILKMWQKIPSKVCLTSWLSMKLFWQLLAEILTFQEFQRWPPAAMLDFENEVKNTKRHFYTHMVISYYSLKFITRTVFELRRIQNENDTNIHTNK